METRTLPKLTDRLKLGSHGLEVSPICIGAVDDPDVVPAAYEAGINFFFITADMHWPIYEQVREGVRRLLDAKPEARDKIVVASVAYVTQPEFCWMPFEEVLSEMPQLKGRIDMTVIGGAYGHEFPTRLAVFKQHRASSFLGVKAIGSSFHDRHAAVSAIQAGELDLAFIRYNPLHPGAATDIFPHVKDTRPLIFNFKSTNGFMEEKHYQFLGIGEDNWRPHQTDYYRFALTEPQLDGALVALPNAAAVQELADALAKGPLDEEDHEYMLQLGELARGAAKVAQAGAP